MLILFLLLFGVCVCEFVCVCFLCVCFFLFFFLVGASVFMNLFYKPVGKTRSERDSSFSEQNVYDTVYRYTYSEGCRRAAVGWHAAWT